MTRYELLDRIGVGGMAEIFRGKAIAAGGFEKPVAIKRILPHLSQDKRFVELLIAEAKVLSLLKHRNIVQIFDVGLGDDGQYFLVMEFVDGVDMGAVQRGNDAKRKRLPFHLALHIGAEVCEALEHAHMAKTPDGRPMSLVHRDVSPSNVLLSRSGEVKLTDFGIAKRAESEQTGHGAVRGKFAYISPEQARNEHIEPRSDVFSVGVLMWEMVTGRRLFSAMDDLAALRAVREAQVQPPTTVDRSLSADIDHVIMSALSKDLRRRPTAGQFGEKLRTIRYQLSATGGDPATELAHIIDFAEEYERESSKSLAAASSFEHVPSTTAKRKTGMSGFEPGEGSEATVIRIRTAAEFGMLDNPNSISDSLSDAKRVIDKFEDEETRLASLSGQQMRMLRSSAGDRESGEIAPPPKSGQRQWRNTEAPTTARAPIDEDAMTTTGPPISLPAASPRTGANISHEPFESDEATRLVAPTNRRTPPPERIAPRVPNRADSAPPTNILRPDSAPPTNLHHSDTAQPTSIHRPAPPTNYARPNPGAPAHRAPSRAVGLGPPPMPDELDEKSRSSRNSWAPGTVHNRNPTATPENLPIQPQPQLDSGPFAQPVPTPVTIARRPPPSQPPVPASLSGSMPSLVSPPGVSEAPSFSQSMSRSISQSQSMNPSAPMLPPPPQSMPPPQLMQPPMAPRQPMPPQAMPPQPPYGAPPQGWGSQPQMRPSAPSAPDLFAQRPSTPGHQPRRQQPASLLQPWMLVVGATIMALLAFLITRAFIK
ncbi:MAG: protein kinase domain-containing protein [Kofleriaceae bacterium]